MRADVNLSVREVGASEFGTRTEMKNLNSFKAITHAIEGERQRQIELIEEGKKVIQETRRWDDNKEYSYAMRSKEDAQDYRYFPDPDLTPIVISDEWIQKIKDSEPEVQAFLTSLAGLVMVLFWMIPYSTKKNLIFLPMIFRFLRRARRWQICLSRRFHLEQIQRKHQTG